MKNFVLREDDRRLARTAGPARSIRDEIMAQPPGERVEYAIGLVELYLDPVPDFYRALDAKGLRLSASMARPLHRMLRRPGQYITREALLAAMMGARHPDEWPEDPTTVKKMISRLRGQIAAAGLPIEIRPLRKVGYCALVPDDFAL